MIRIHRHTAPPALTGQGFLRGRMSWIEEDVHRVEFPPGEQRAGVRAPAIGSVGAGHYFSFQAAMGSGSYVCGRTAPLARLDSGPALPLAEEGQPALRAAVILSTSRNGRIGRGATHARGSWKEE
jgi:hypothetical protein